MRSVVISLVSYGTNLKELSKVLSFTKDLKKIKHKVYIFDNANQKNLKLFCKKKKINYFASKDNLGFGNGHNYNINKTIKIKPVYLILNPDIYLNSKQFIYCLKVLQSKKKFGLLSPKLVNPDGTIQLTCRLIPNFFDFIIRFFLGYSFSSLKIHNIIEKYKNEEYFVNIPFIHGACYFIKSEVINTVGVYDKNFFLYVEDLDLYRRILEKFDTIYLNSISVKHLFKRSSRKNFKLFIIHLKSILYYFLKWGFVNDYKKNKLNKNWK
jgi:GT2 family glycosyltransferase